MQPNDKHLTRQEDDVTASDSPEDVNEFTFGYWPEIVGLIMTLAILWVIFQ